MVPRSDQNTEQLHDYYIHEYESLNVPVAKHSVFVHENFGGKKTVSTAYKKGPNRYRKVEDT